MAPRGGTLSLLLDAVTPAGEPDLTYRQLAADEDAARPLVEAIQRRSFSAACSERSGSGMTPTHRNRARSERGASEHHARLLQVYAEPPADRQGESNGTNPIRRPLRGAGLDERTLMEFGSDSGNALWRSNGHCWRSTSTREQIWMTIRTITLSRSDRAGSIARASTERDLFRAITVHPITGNAARGAARFAGDWRRWSRTFVPPWRETDPVARGRRSSFQGTREAVFAARDMTEGPARGLRRRPSASIRPGDLRVTSTGRRSTWPRGSPPTQAPDRSSSARKRWRLHMMMICISSPGTSRTQRGPSTGRDLRSVKGSLSPQVGGRPGAAAARSVPRRWSRRSSRSRRRRGKAPAPPTLRRQRPVGSPPRCTRPPTPGSAPSSGSSRPTAS